MSDTTNVCRLCLNVVLPDKCSAFDTTVTQKLKLLIPNLTLTPVGNLVICNGCQESLEETSKLKRTCSSSNKLIKFLKNYLGLAHAVELKELIKGNNKKQEENWPKYGYVCRICLKSNEGQYISIADAKTQEFGVVFSSCLSILEENLTTDPVICKICIDVLHKMCAFVKQCHDVEERVNSYSKSVPGEVDLFKLINSANDDLTCQNGEEEVPKEEERPSTEQFDRNAKENEECLKEELKLLVEEQDKDISDLAPKEYTEEDIQRIPKRYVHKDIPYFRFGVDLIQQPYDRRAPFTQWLAEVEKIKLKQQLSDRVVIQKILEMMIDLTSSKVQECFSSVANWPEFKEMLLRAFPESDDFCLSWEKVVRIRRRRKVSFVAYYEAKMDSMKPLNFTEEQMVSFLIGGINNPPFSIQARISQPKTPEEVLALFKVFDEEEKQFTAAKLAKWKAKEKEKMKKARESQEIPDQAHQDNKEILELENRSISEEKPQESASENNAAQENATTSLGGAKCACCDKFGHSSMTCPMLRNKPEAEASEGRNSTIDEVIVIDEEMPQQEIVLDKEKENRPVEKAEDVVSEADAKKKCSCCDKLGHTSMNCPFIVAKNGDVNSEVGRCFNCKELGHKFRNCTHPKVKKDKDPQESPQKCWKCKDTGHLSANCPLVNSNSVNASTTSTSRQIEKEPQKQTAAKTASKNSETPTKKCWNCNQAGHSSKKCPIGKEPQKQTAAQTASKNTETPTKKCWNCNQAGHSSKKCPIGKEPQKQTAAQTANQSKEICRNCNRSGHSLRNCPLPNSNNVSLTSSSWSIGKEPQKQTAAQTPNKSKEAPTKNCWNCNQSGHAARNCPRVNSKNVLASVAGNIWQIGHESQKQTAAQTPIQNCRNCKQSGHSSSNCPIPNSNNVTVSMASHIWQIGNGLQQQTAAQMQNLNTESAPRWCLGCNQPGHLFQNCPRNIVQAGRWQIESQKQTQAQTSTTTAAVLPPVCWFCKQPGHLFQFCPLFKNNVANAQGQTRWPNIEKCSTCNVYGHSASNCPVVEAVKIAAMPWMAQPREERKVEAPPPQNKPTRKRRCLCCNNVDHSSLDCPLLKNNKGNQPEKVREPQEPEKCMCCGKTGHPTFDCPYYGIFQGKTGHGGASQEQTPAKRAKLEEKCYFCDQTGHSSSDCFRTRFEKPARPGSPELLASQVSYTDPSVVVMSSHGLAVCEFCKKIGHRVSECFEASFDRKTYEAHHGPGSSRHCLSCGKFGHLPSDCPKNKRSPGSAKTSRSRRRRKD